MARRCIYLDLFIMGMNLGQPLSLFQTACVMCREHGDLRRGGRLFSMCLEKTRRHTFHEGRRRGAKRIQIAGDFNIELGLLCTGDEEDENLFAMYGRNVGKDLGRSLRCQANDVVRMCFLG